ncbi:PaaI family thioesterase [Sphingobium sp. CR2-8]|uniref:PaaI family thioesterase n=1 Tax=Sphingobium sp. CR2-8 TaxID=1306534 RepID=UPI002DBA67C5|nr:PaaI family thioesterase [Sphingobium sp. CR2-8]MEC3909108.1 PaaI family thioesterase [Sphingobium sp. CR2-8]
MSEIIGDSEIETRASQHGLTARIELAQAIRTLLDDFSCSMADDAVFDEAAANIRDTSTLLAQQPSRPAHVRYIEGALTGLDALSELGPFTGRLHPLPPAFRLVLNGDRAEAYATYSHAHQGAPGLLQGGFIAATFDELLAIVQTGVIRMTADLQIAYRAPTPLYKELRYTTWLDRVDGRKAYTKGTLHDGDRLCAEATGLFVEPRTRPF